jgi:nitrile hydratase subunit beta
MDGIHDLGGKQGFGPIDTSESPEPFHHDWEGRMWAISQSCKGPDWTIDWWRHVRERMDPDDYLTRPYFDQWCQTFTAAFVTSGVFSLAEATSGHTDRQGPPASALSPAEVLQADRDNCLSFELPAGTAAAFRPGDPIRTKAHIAASHTRLPHYARAKPGTIHTHHGAHVLPDKSAAGEEVGEHLYTVAFRATDIWPGEANPRDTIYLDLWESYLERA